MIKAEAWLQCSARGILVTRLAYIVGFTPLLLERDPPPALELVDQERKRERNLGTPRKHLGFTSECLLPPVWLYLLPQVLNIVPSYSSRSSLYLSL